MTYDNTTSGLTATDIQAALDERVVDFDAHIVDAVDAHDASAISNVASGNLVATEVQAALNELQTELDSATSGVATNVTNIASNDTQLARGDNHGKNLIINGDFSVAQRGTSFTGTSEYTLDRLRLERVGSTCTTTQQTHTLGQTAVPSHPTNFLRSVVTTSAGAGNFVRHEYRIEDLSRFSGEEVTLSFSANADASKNIATEFTQNFGTGGSPSTAVTGIGIATHALTTTDTEFSTTVTLTSLSGKTLGTNGDDYLEIVIWLEAGSNFNARTSTLGQQSGTFEFSNLMLEYGDTATDFEVVPPADQLARCQRYFYSLNSDGAAKRGITTALSFSTTSTSGSFTYPVPLRGLPTVTFISAASNYFATSGIGAELAGTSVGSFLPTSASTEVQITVASGLTVGQASLLRMNSTAAIHFDSEL